MHAHSFTRSHTVHGFHVYQSYPIHIFRIQVNVDIILYEDIISKCSVHYSTDWHERNEFQKYLRTHSWNYRVHFKQFVLLKLYFRLFIFIYFIPAPSIHSIRITNFIKCSNGFVDNSMQILIKNSDSFLSYQLVQANLLVCMPALGDRLKVGGPRVMQLIQRYAIKTVIQKENQRPNRLE